VRDLVAELEARDISARIQRARKEAGLTQEQLADLLEVIPRSVQNYESGRVPWNKINAIGKITGKSPEWLLHGDAPDPFEGRPAAKEQDQLLAIQETLESQTAALEDLQQQLGVVLSRLEPPASGAK
jgi:transcriptional regulator with XRE-family HTH domain